MCKAKAHTGRPKKFTARVSKEVIDTIDKLAAHYKVTPAVIIRATIIWGTRGIKSRDIKFTKSRYLSQRECASTWKKDKKKTGEWVKNGSSELQHLKEANEDAIMDAQDANNELYEERKRVVQMMSQAGRGYQVWYDDGVGNHWDTEAIDEIIEKDQLTNLWNQYQSAIKGLDAKSFDYQIQCEIFWPMLYRFEESDVTYFFKHGEWKDEGLGEIKDLLDQQFEEPGYLQTVEDIKESHMEQMSEAFDRADKWHEEFKEKSQVDQLNELRQMMGSAFARTVVPQLDQEFHQYLTPEEMEFIKKKD